MMLVLFLFNLVGIFRLISPPFEGGVTPATTTAGNSIGKVDKIKGFGCGILDGVVTAVPVVVDVVDCRLAVGVTGGVITGSGNECAEFVVVIRRQRTGEKQSDIDSKYCV
jgi:type II secretory pathway component PulC